MLFFSWRHSASVARGECLWFLARGDYLKTCVIGEHQKFVLVSCLRHHLAKPEQLMAILLTVHFVVWEKTNKKNPKVVSLWFSTARAIARPSHYTFSHVQKKSSCVSTVKKLFLFRLNSARQKKLWNSLAINNCRSRRRAKLNHFPIDNQPIGKGLSNKGVSHEFASINWEC